MSRVVITGLGLITSLENDLTSSWEGFLQGNEDHRRETGDEQITRCWREDHAAWHEGLSLLSKRRSQHE